jgi:hypothetical protein
MIFTLKLANRDFDASQLCGEVRRTSVREGSATRWPGTAQLAGIRPVGSVEWPTS